MGKNQQLSDNIWQSKTISREFLANLIIMLDTNV